MIPADHVDLSVEHEQGAARDRIELQALALAEDFLAQRALGGRIQRPALRAPARIIEPQLFRAGFDQVRGARSFQRN